MVEVRWNAEVAQLYRELDPKLRRILARNVRAPADVLEEAGQIAWISWLGHRQEVRRQSMLGWLSTTATREALRILRMRAREQPRDLAREDGDPGVVIAFPARESDPQRAVEFRDRLAEVRRLPDRQQRMVWMRGVGYDYAEIGACTGDTTRTVERQLARADRRLRAVE